MGKIFESKKFKKDFNFLSPIKYRAWLKIHWLANLNQDFKLMPKT